MKRQERPKVAEVRKGISVLWETLQCPICLELMTTPVSTKCDHQFCKFCIMKLLDNSKQNGASCPVCKDRVTRRSLQESPGFQKLVAGLQDMIQAYEHDTGTNYFTGQMLPTSPAVVTDALVPKNIRTNEGPVELANLENACSEGVPKSQSSTIKAQNGFARLMELEDSSPLTTENEGLDSGLGGAPAESEKKIGITTDILKETEDQSTENVQATLKTRVLIKSSDLPPLILEEENVENAEEEHDCGLPSETLLRKKHKKASRPDKILKRRQKKSVEKVRQWLINVPNEEDIELDQPDKSAQDLDDSDSCSSSSTIDLKQQNYESFLNEKDGQTKPLEDQVFGAVYKRGKRRNGNDVSPLLNILTRLNSNNAIDELEDESTNKNDTEKEPAVINLVDDNSEFFNEATHMDTEVHNESHSDKQPQQELNELHDVINKCEEKDASPLPKIGNCMQRKTSRKKMLNALEQVDVDLQEQAKTEPGNSKQNKTDKRKGRLSKLTKAKCSRVAKPLNLIEVQTAETVPMDEPKSKLESDQVQVHIENYPSSEDQDAAAAAAAAAAAVKSNRRSKRLQSFVEEIRISTKKSKLKVTNSHKGKASEEVQVVLAKNNTSPKCAKMNGCIYSEDLGGIEKVCSSESPNILKQTLQEVPSIEVPCEDGTCEAVAPDSRKTLDEDTNTVQESDYQTDPNKSESMGCEDELEEQMDEDKSDSEIDTEQLLKSFKATKRKSFHLEAPNVRRSCSVDERDAQKSENIDPILRKHAVEIEKSPIQDAFPNNSNSLFSDMIPPSPTQNKEEYQEVFHVPDKPISDNSPKSSTSGALSPNKVSKLETPISHLSIIPQIVNSGLRFTAGNLSDSVPKKQSTKCSHISESQCSKSEENSVSLLGPSPTKNQSPGKLPQRLLNTEYSLTPDGLLTCPSQNVEVAHSHGSSSAQSSIRNNQGRRRSRRLESSPELDSSGSKEELPSLAQMLKRKSSSIQETSQQEKVAPTQIKKRLTDEEDQTCRPTQCPSPDSVNSSQASVDLFGTPEESGDLPIHNTSTSVEMSQMSSEVLATQQKLEMQRELVRLEKLMALVSEVLHEKENEPENTEQSSSMQAPESTRAQPFNEETGHGSETIGPPSSGRNTRRRTSEVKAATKTSVAKHDPTTNTDVGAPATKTVATSSSTTQSHKTQESPSEDKENTPNDTRKPKMVLVSSGLGPSEQIIVKKFAKRIGSRVVSQVTPDVTHIIMHTDEQLVCERTLKYFLGIAGRKWVVSFQWISECFKQKKLLDESLFEVKGDVVNGHNHQGPMRARTTDEDHLLMKGYEICFQGTFTDMTTDEMEWMVEQCGAAVVKDPSVLDGKQKSRQLVVVQSGSDISASKYNSLSRVATVVTRGWLLDSVSAYTIQNCKNYSV